MMARAKPDSTSNEGPKRCYECLMIVHHFENQERFGGRLADLLTP